MKALKKVVLVGLLMSSAVAAAGAASAYYDAQYHVYKIIVTDDGRTVY